MAKSPSPPIALAKLDLEEKTLEVRLRFKGKAAVDVADYQRAYQAAHGLAVEAEPLILNIIQAHIEGDKGFQAWRKANPMEASRGRQTPPWQATGRLRASDEGVRRGDGRPQGFLFRERRLPDEI